MRFIKVTICLAVLTSLAACTDGHPKTKVAYALPVPTAKPSAVPITIAHPTTVAHHTGA